MSKMKKIFIILKNVGISYLISVILLMVYALLLAYTKIPESTISVATLIISFMSVFIGSSLSLIQMKENGIIHGAIIGMVYVFVLYLLSSIFMTGFSLNGYAISMIIFNVLFGMIGGIIGVNMIKEERKRT